MKTKLLFGTRKADGATIYLHSPTWARGWYWSFGYLGNSREHYHLSGYAEGRNINMYDALLADYKLNPRVKAKLWVFCELVKTAYTLKDTAQLLGRGDSHYTANPCAELIKNPDEVARINTKVLPAIFEQIYLIFEDHSNAGTLDDNIKALLGAVSEMVVTTRPPPAPIKVALHPATCRSIEEGDCRSYLDEYGSVFNTQEQMAVVKGALEQLVPSVEVSFNASDDWGVEDKSNV